MAVDKNIAAFLDESAYTISCKFPRWASAKPPEIDEYTYVTNIPGIKEGDYVVVPSTQVFHGHKAPAFAVVLVVGVDSDVELEPNDPITYTWVAAKFDPEQLFALNERNEKLAKTLAGAYKRNLRRSFADNILGALPEEQRLAITAQLGNKGN